jgi:hypothetical protein
MWAVVPIGIGCAVAMAATTNVIMGIAFGVLLATYLLIRKGRI